MTPKPLTVLSSDSCFWASMLNTVVRVLVAAVTLLFPSDQELISPYKISTHWSHRAKKGKRQSLVRENLLDALLNSQEKNWNSKKITSLGMKGLKTKPIWWKAVLW